MTVLVFIIGVSAKWLAEACGPRDTGVQVTWRSSGSNRCILQDAPSQNPREVVVPCCGGFDPILPTTLCNPRLCFLLDVGIYLIVVSRPKLIAGQHTTGRNR